MKFSLIPNVSVLLKAIKFAQNAHKSQFRKISGDPYYHHTVAVMMMVMLFKKSKHLSDLLVAALLHDVLEDTSTTFNKLVKEFGELVGSLVLELTNNNDEILKIGKLEYHKKKLCGISSYALVIKLCDRLHNVSDNPTQKMLTETLHLMDYLKKNRKLSKTQKLLVAEIISVCQAS